MTLDEFTKYTFTLLIPFCLGVAVGCYCGSKYNSPIEKDDVIDSLIKINDSMKLKVEHLDSIKNAKVIEVSTLDNDSTLKLFYELVSE